MKVPYCVIPPKVLDRHHDKFLALAEKVEVIFPYLGLYLKQARLPITSKRYLAMCLMNGVVIIIISWIFMSLLFFRLQTGLWYFYGFVTSLLLFLFILLQQMYYPKIIINRRIRNLERHSLFALQSILIQIRSGVPLFDVMVNIAGANYGEISEEFLKVVKQINAGKHQIEALEIMTLENPSIIFRRAIWQLINGMKAGADMSDVIKEIMDTVSQEQLIQIERYGGQLSPMSMFYMIIAVIFPTLGINFLIIIAAFISLSDFGVKVIFWSVYGFVLFFQFMFLGFIKSRRPSLIADN